MQPIALRGAIRLWIVLFLAVIVMLGNPSPASATVKVISIAIFTDIDLKAYSNNGDIGPAPVGSLIIPAPKVIVRDVNDQPLSNVEVIFEVTSGNGSITGGTTTTNENGIAEVGGWTLGELPGINTLTATVMSLSHPVSTSFTATGTARAPIKLVLMTQPVGGASGALLETQPVIKITDTNGNPVENPVTVTVTSNGTLGGTTTVTTLNGVAVFTDLTLAGTVDTDFTLTFTASGLPTIVSNTITFANTPDLTALVLSGTYSGYNFSRSTYLYTSVTVQSNVSSITVTPTGTGTMKVNGSSLLSGQTSQPITLIAGSPTAITVVVTEPDKSPKTYSLIVTRLPVTTMVLGYRFGGGVVGYIFRAGDSGYIAGQSHGIIVMTSDLSVSEAWSNITSAGIGTTGTVTGSGSANSDAIIAQNGHTASAAKKCIDYAGSGYKDWFLPGKDELDKLYELKLRNFGNFSGIYWSSSEFNADSAWCQDFSNRVSSTSLKTSLLRVRAVRIF